MDPSPPLILNPPKGISSKAHSQAEKSPPNDVDLCRQIILLPAVQPPWRCPIHRCDRLSPIRIYVVATHCSLVWFLWNIADSTDIRIPTHFVPRPRLTLDHAYSCLYHMESILDIHHHTHLIEPVVPTILPLFTIHDFQRSLDRRHSVGSAQFMSFLDRVYLKQRTYIPHQTSGAVSENWIDETVDELASWLALQR